MHFLLSGTQMGPSAQGTDFCVRTLPRTALCTESCDKYSTDGWACSTLAAGAHLFVGDEKLDWPELTRSNRQTG